MAEAAVNEEGRAYIVNPETGERGSVDVAELGALPAGWRTQSADEVLAQQRAAQYGTVGQTALTAAEGVARGATFGGSDVLLSELGGEGYREGALARQEANPLAALGGEVAGTVAPVLLSGGAGLAGTVARATPAALAARGAAAAGRGVTRGAAALGFEGTGLGSRVAAGAARLGAEGAVEGALYGAGQAVSQAALHDTELTAEKVLSGGLEGLELGALGGAGLGALGTLGGAVGKRVLGAKGTGKAAGEVAEEAGAGLAERLSARQTMKSVGMGADDLGGLVATHGEARVAQMSKRLHDEGLIGLSDSAAVRAQKIERAAIASKEELAALRKRLDASSADAPDAAAVVMRVRDEVLAPLQATAAETGVNRPLIKQVERAVMKPLRKSLEKGEKLSFESWANIRDRLDTIAKSGGDREALGRAAKVIEDETEKAIGNAAQDLQQAYKTAKARHTDLTTVASGAAKAAGQRDDKFFNLTDNLFTAGGFITGVATGSVGMHAVQGLALGFASKVIREHGTVALSKLTRRIADANERRAVAVKAIVNDKAPKPHPKKASDRPLLVEAALGGGVAAAMPELPAPPTPRHATPGYNAVVQQVQEFEVDPTSIGRRVAEQLGPLAQTEPQLTQAIVDTVLKDVGYLQQHMPRAYSRAGSSMTPLAEAPEIPKHAVASFMKRVEALRDPTSVAEAIANGDIALEAIDALKVRRPKMYAEIREDIIRETSQMGERLPFSRRTVLGIAFEFTSDPSLDRQFLSGVQQTYATAHEAVSGAADKPPPPPPGGESKSAEAAETTMQRIAGG